VVRGEYDQASTLYANFLVGGADHADCGGLPGPRTVIPATPPAPVQTPAIRVSPSSGKPGTPVAVTGSSWRPGDNVIISLQDPALASGDQGTAQVASAVVDQDGRFAAAFALPAEAPWIDLPRVMIKAHALAAGTDAAIEFEIERETVTPTSVAFITPTPPAAGTPPPGCTDRVTFAGDVTMPDQTSIAPGASFIKTWRLRNDGTCTWDATYALVFARGDSLGGPNAAALPGPVPPGSTVDVSVGLSAPAGNGVYRGFWQLRNGAGQVFGIGSDGLQPFWVHIVVGPTPTPVPSAAWRGEYFANRDLAGAPALVRDDADVNFDWRAASPAPQIPADDFSVRWTRWLSLGAGTYRFLARSDDGMRVWLNNELIIDQWHAATNTTYSADRTLSGGTYALRVEYYENKGDAHAQFWWERADSFPQWRGEYFSNAALSGAAAVVRNDADINFNWGQGAPANGLPSDNFSVRWSRTMRFDEGSYRFHLLSDDGFRLYVDGALMLDDWSDGSARNTAVNMWLPAGDHTLRLEYYERSGNALIQLWWEKIGGNYPDWKGEYWNNRNFSGSPIMTRNDRAIDFNWGNGSPAPGIPADNFSARWSRTVQAARGLYRFIVRADDGVRVSVDGNRIIDEWHLNDGRNRYQAEMRLDGAHQIVVEYFEAGAGARVDVSWSRVDTRPTSTATATGTPTATPTSVPVPQPGMVIQGRVTLDDAGQGGVANVKIYRSFASYPGVVVATTDQDGRYVTPFQPVPGDEMVTVWAEREGYTFEPARYNWRHYFGFQVYQLDFAAKPVVVPATVAPTATGEPPKPTATPTAALEPPQPTATPTAVEIPITPTSTATLVPTMEAPPTATATAASVPPVGVPPAPAFTATIRPPDNRAVISEILPAPQNADWNGDGSVDTRDEWIELANRGGSAVDVGGWSLDDNGRGSYVIPIGTVLQPQQYLVFFGGQTGLNLSDEGGQVQLRSADGRTVDRVRYDAIPGDGSYSRDDAGDWHADWPPSPGAPSGQPGNVVARASEPSLGAPEAALLSIVEQVITAIKELIFGFFR
jgi:hypothetical protein